MSSRLGRVLLPCTAVVAVVVAGGIVWPYTVDDAYIVARYATRWATGLGYTMNDGPPTDGVTGPAFTAIVALGVRAGIDPIALAKGLGVASAALSSGFVVSRLRSQAAGTYPATWAMLALAAQTTLVVWSVGGLATGFAGLLVTLVALESTDRSVPRGVLIGACVGAFAWIRPEVLLFGAIVIVGLFGVSRREATIAAAISLLGVVSVMIFRLVIFGNPFPLSLAAKGGDLLHGVKYVIAGIALCTGVGGLFLARFGASVGPRHRTLALALVAHLLAVALLSGDWMPGYRLLSPMIPAYVLLAAQGLRYGVLSPVKSRLVLGAAALAVAVPAADLAVQVPLVRRAGLARAERARPVVEQLVSNCTRVATVDVGYLAYTSRVEVVDLGGLTDPSVARLPGGHLSKPVTPSYLSARDPDCVLLHSSVVPRTDERGRLRQYAGFPVEERLVKDPWLWARYRVHSVTRFASRYYYVLLTRRPALTRTRDGRTGQVHENHPRGAETMRTPGSRRAADP